MSFNAMKRDELLKVAEAFAVEVKEDANRPEIIEALKENGVDWKTFKDSLNQKAVDVDVELPEEDEETVSAPVEPAAVVSKEVDQEKVVKRSAETRHVVKMTRKNASYSTRGYKWTKEHPYALVREADVDFFVNELKGFSLATPKEVASYYN